MDIGNKIRYFRKFRNLTLKDLAKMVDLSEQAIGQYERNQRKPNIDRINKIAESLDIPVTFLLSDDTFNNYMEGKLKNFNNRGYELNDGTKSTSLPAISLNDMKDTVNSAFPAFEAEINFLSNPNIEKCFNYSFRDLEEKEYSELLISNIENCIKNTLKEIEENEERGSIYAACWGRWIDKDNPRYENVKKIKESISKNK